MAQEVGSGCQLLTGASARQRYAVGTLSIVSDGVTGAGQWTDGLRHCMRQECSPAFLAIFSAPGFKYPWVTFSV